MTDLTDLERENFEILNKLGFCPRIVLVNKARIISCGKEFDISLNMEHFGNSLLAEVYARGYKDGSVFVRKEIKKAMGFTNDSLN